MNHAAKPIDWVCWVKPRVKERERFGIRIYVPTTAQVRRWFQDRTTPPGIRHACWQILHYRRQRTLATRRGL